MTHKKDIKITLIVDSLCVSKYTYDFVKWCSKNKNINLCDVIIQKKNKPNFKKPIFERVSDSLWSRLWRMIQFIERRRLSEKNKDHQKLYSLKEFSLNEINIDVIASKSGFVHRFSDDDISLVKSNSYDYIYRACNGILRGKILNAAKHGILSFHHGDNRSNRGGPAGWWEVVLKEVTTGFTLQILTDELDGGDVFCRGNFPTKTYYLENQAEVQRRSLVYLYNFLNKIIEGKEPHPSKEKTPYYMPLYRQPKIKDLFFYLGYLLKLSIISNFNKILNIDVEPKWHISYSHENWKETALWRSKTINNNKNSYFADPFLISKGSKSYCFCEEIDKSTKKGVISLIEISGNNQEYKGIILAEPFHLSFPFIFEIDDMVYMIPESAENNDIRLYECVDFPLQWKLKTVLIDNISATDSIVFFKDSKYWLLTNSSISDESDHSSELMIYYSNSLISNNWTPHQNNPVIIDASCARNAGYIYNDETLYRVSQKIGFNTYGTGININKIKVLTTTEYREELASKILPKFKKKLRGTHHMSSNENMTVIDHY